MNSSDIVDDIFTRVRSMLGDDFEGKIEIKLDEVENDVRKYWGGRDAYVTKKNGRKIRENALREINNGTPISVVIQKYAISRTGVYSLLRRK